MSEYKLAGGGGHFLFYLHPCCFGDDTQWDNRVKRSFPQLLQLWIGVLSNWA